MLAQSFFRGSVVEIARAMVGVEWEFRGERWRVVETEAYAELGDPACHLATRPSARKFAASSEPGAAYVYLNYGVHWLLNFLTYGQEGSGFVLIRAMEKLGVGEGDEGFRVAAGPGKLTRRVGIDGRHHGMAWGAAALGRWWSGRRGEILEGPRIGIRKGCELNWRFGCALSRCLSRPFPEGR